MVEQELRPLKTLGELSFDGLLDNSWSGETDQRARLRDNNVAKHGEGSGNASRGWMGKYRDVWEMAFAEPSEGG